MAILDQACIQGKTVFFPQSLKRVYALEVGQEIKIPNGWGHTALIMAGTEVIGYCCIKDKFDAHNNWAGKEIDTSH